MKIMLLLLFQLYVFLHNKIVVSLIVAAALLTFFCSSLKTLIHTCTTLFYHPPFFPTFHFLSPFTVKKQHGNVRWGHGGRVHCTIPVKLICNPYFFLKILIKKYNNTLKRGSFIIDWPILDSPRMVRFSVQGLHSWRTILFNAARVFQILIYSVLHMF